MGTSAGKGKIGLQVVRSFEFIVCRPCVQQEATVQLMLMQWQEKDILPGIKKTILHVAFIYFYNVKHYQLDVADGATVFSRNRDMLP